MQTVAAPPDQTPRTSFDSKYLAHTFVTPAQVGGYAWDVGRIREARAQHLLGNFTISAWLADALRDDGAIFSTMLQRIAPPLGLPREVKPASYYGGRGKAKTAAEEAEDLFAYKSTACPPGVLADMFEVQAMMGVAILQNIWKPRPDGSRLDVTVQPWPMRSTIWNASLKRYQVQTSEGLIAIEHGDAKWIIMEPYAQESFRWGAIRALALCWADRQFGKRDRSEYSEAHGLAKPIGTLPEDISIESKEGQAMLRELRKLQQARSGMLKPFGSTVEFLEAKALAYQVFENIIKGEDSEIARILLGQDGTTQNSGGNYKKASSLWGVRNDIIERDLSTASYALSSGLLYPWTVINYGSPDYASEICWLMPDLDEDARRESLAARNKAFNADIAAYRLNGFDVTQNLVDDLAEQYGVLSPKLKPEEPPPATPGLPGMGEAVGQTPPDNGAPDAATLEKDDVQ